MNAKDSVFQLLKDSGNPLSRAEICEELNISQRSTAMAINSLLEEGKILESKTAETRTVGTRTIKTFFTIADSNPEINVIREMQANYAEQLDSLKNEYTQKLDAADIRMQDMERKQNKLYVDMVSIMSIFVAMFSLILTNIEFISSVSIAECTNQQLLVRILILNIPLLLGIAMLVFLIRIIIINKLSKK